MKSLDNQVGGDHYKLSIQPLEFINANNLPFMEGNVVKYVVRHRNKNGKQDLEKAKDYIDKMIEFYYPDMSSFEELCGVSCDCDPWNCPCGID